MASPFPTLPREAFDEKVRPYIKRLNIWGREMSGLEGVIRQPISTRASDLTVTRRGEFQVAVSRITPSISSVVSGVSTVVGIPALVLGTVNTIGSTTSAVSTNSAIALFGTGLPAALASAAAVGTSAFSARADHAHIFPPTLRSTANASTLTLTDDATDQTLTGSLGTLNLRPTAFTLSLPRWTGGGEQAATVGTVLSLASLTSALPAVTTGILANITVDNADTGTFRGIRVGCGPNASATGLAAANFMALDFSPISTSINLGGTQTIANRLYIDFSIPRLLGGLNTVVTDTGLMQSGAWPVVAVTAGAWANAYIAKL